MSQLREDLLEIFAPYQGNPGGTGAVLTTPSKIDMEVAQAAVKEIALDEVFRDLGGVVAREAARAMERYNLKPSDYANLDDLAQILAVAVSKNVVKSEAFKTAFRQHLSMRG